MGIEVVLYASAVMSSGGVASPRDSAYPNQGGSNMVRDDLDDGRSMRSKRLSRGDTMESLPMG